ncbi:MAG: rod shape-determining protein MreC [Deltaproteobacteria bacterium]|nr:rod shape-determining protein MreC [Deltaproteobacteria bacterium]
MLLLALIFLSSNVERSKSWNPVAGIMIEILAPVQKAVKGSVNFTTGLWSKYIGLINTHDENLALKKDIERLMIENSKNRELLSTYKRLEELLKFTENTEETVLASQVIGRDPTGLFRSIIIDKGKNSGIKENMPVVNAKGVVGQIVSVSNNYSKVLLLIDQNSAVDCIIERSRDSGILKGISPKECTLDYVLKASDVRVGDLVITSGLDRVYPKGNYVGIVTEVEDSPGELYKKVKIKPSVDFSKLEEVLVLLREDPLSNPMIEKQ